VGVSSGRLDVSGLAMVPPFAGIIAADGLSPASCEARCQMPDPAGQVMRDRRMTRTDVPRTGNPARQTASFCFWHALSCYLNHNCEIPRVSGQRWGAWAV